MNFAEAVAQMQSQPEDEIVYDVQIPGAGFSHDGDLMTRDYFIGACNEGLFIDDDGFGDQINTDGHVIYLNEAHNIVALIKPSDVDIDESAFDPNCAYVLWYNK